jgi:nucleoside-diphosphate-sugar epimerase
MTIASLRFHHVVPTKKDLAEVAELENVKKDFWGWVSSESAARACLLTLQADWKGHEVMLIVADDHAAYPLHAADLARKCWPSAKIKGGELKKDQSFFSCAKAERLLGWKHVGGKQP